MPKTANTIVIWQEEKNAYAWHQQGKPVPVFFSIEEEHRFSPLLKSSACSSFAFQGRRGRLTIRKEERQHGEGYWYAYRNQGRKTHKKYVGRTDDLTLTRLEETAAILYTRTSTVLPISIASSQEQMHSLTAQQSSLLTPKISLPRLQSSLVPRQRLLTRLDAGLDRKMTVISAPAGTGKTTLVCQWINEHQSQVDFLPIAWVSLDSTDNDPIRFWHYILNACQSFNAQFGETALTYLQRIQQSPFEPSPLADALTAFLNELNQLPYKALLVLEDYHVITAPQVHKTLTFMLDHLPTTLHLMIITRTDPPVSLARLRAQNELNELRNSDLRFSPEEIGMFLQQTISAPPTPDIINTLDTQIEGWITGLRLATLALQGQTTRANLNQALTTFSGNHRHIIEFFVSEVLEAQPAELQTFLLQTSILNRLTSSLCDAVTGRADSDQLLSRVESANLFLLPLDDNAHWYRYHALFAEAMQHVAHRRLGSNALIAGYKKASQWYEQQELFPDAIEMALLAQDFSSAARLVVHIIRPNRFFALNEHHTFRRWLEMLPVGILEHYPILCIFFTIVLFMDFHAHKRDPAYLSRMEKNLALAERIWLAEENYSELSVVYALRSLIANWNGDFAQGTVLARQALNWLPEHQQQWRSACLATIAKGEFQAGHLTTARLMLQEAYVFAQCVGNYYAVQAAQLFLGDFCVLQGEPQQAITFYQDSLASVKGDQLDRCRVHISLARLFYLQNDLARAEQEASNAHVVAEKIENEDLQGQTALVFSQIHQARGQSKQARDILQPLLAKTLSQQASPLHHALLAWQARLQIVQGEFDAVERWCAARNKNGDQSPQLQIEQEELVIARLYLAQNKSDEALALLTPWLDDAHQHGRVSSEIEILLLMALASQAQGKQERAIEQLKGALHLARPAYYLRIFLDEGEAVQTLVQALLPTIRQTALVPFVRTLLFAFVGKQSEQGITATTEPLSPQEERVLQLLLAGNSNAEIAQNLVVSINTIKTQVRSIFRKLHVTNRKEAREVMRQIQ